MTPSNVAEKVEFVTNLSGTSLTEIVAIGSSVPIAILLRRALSLYPGINGPVCDAVLDYATVIVIPLAVSEPTMPYTSHRNVHLQFWL